MGTTREMLMVGYTRETTWDGVLWKLSFELIVQPWWLVGTPFGRKIRHGGGFCGSNPDAPSLPIVFGNYPEAAWDAAVYLRCLGLKISDADKLGWCKAGGSLRSDREWMLDDFPGLREKIMVADKLFRYAPLLNHRLKHFSIRHWVTIFEGALPLRWSKDQPTATE